MYQLNEINSQKNISFKLQCKILERKKNVIRVVEIIDKVTLK